MASVLVYLDFVRENTPNFYYTKKEAANNNIYNNNDQSQVLSDPYCDSNVNTTYETYMIFTQ